MGECVEAWPARDVSSQFHRMCGPVTADVTREEDEMRAGRAARMSQEQPNLNNTVYRDGNGARHPGARAAASAGGLMRTECPGP